MARYAITFDLDTAQLQDLYRNESYNNAYYDIRRVLVSDWGFEWQQGSVYFSKEDISPVDCVLAVQDLEKQFDWFVSSVRDIRMLRIEETNDLKPVLGRTYRPAGKKK